jgi:hypothetical protein
MAKTASIKLPNAPLVEAVFELRWAVQPGLGYADPGFPYLHHDFTKRIGGGFPVHRDMGPPDALPAPYAIARRFYVAPETEFPLLQIGPGIFAANQSVDYDWPSFKRLIADGIHTLLSSYPKSASFPIRPNYLELRYVDAFDASLVETADLIQFIKAGTTMRLDAPPFFSQIDAAEVKGRIVLHALVKKWKDTQFILDLGSGSRGGAEDIVRLETKVVTQAAGVPKMQPSKFLKDLDRWLEFAHGLTSPFFKKFVTDNVMSKFKRTK